MSLKTVGNSIQGYLNGNLILEATDGSLDEGGVGLFCKGMAGVWFDDLTVTYKTE